MINNNIICIIFIPRIAFAWFQPKRSDIECWVVKVITVIDSIFRCSGTHTSPLLSRVKIIYFPFSFLVSTILVFVTVYISLI